MAFGVSGRTLKASAVRGTPALNPDPNLSGGGACTFNAPGTFRVPSRVSRLTVRGLGGEGNPGNLPV